MHQLQFFSFWRLVGYLLVTLVVVLSLIPPPVDVPVENGDKFEHLFAYGVMMMWFVWVYERWGLRLLCGLMLTAMGIGLEFLQGLTTYRTFDPFDMVANTAGVGLGLTTALLGMPNCLLWLERLYRRSVRQQV